MQCHVNSMSESKESRVSDTLPKRGRVTEVCKEWLIHEDGALAYKLQREEVEQHYSGNKTRNAQVREDFPRAKDEQLREEIEARLKYQQMISQQEEEDARIARLLAQHINKEEENRSRLASEDEELAREFQRCEKLKAIEKERYPFSFGSSQSSSTPPEDANTVGLPSASNVPSSVNYLMHTLQNPKSKPSNISVCQDESQSYRSVSNDYGSIIGDIDDLPQEEVENLLSDRELEEEAIRRLQEQKDEELARLLQEQEKEVNSQSFIDRDRLLAIEAQDKELARLLHERERAKLKRARERAKQKALAKKQQQELEDGKESSLNASVDASSEKLSKLKLSSSHSFDESSKSLPGRSRSQNNRNIVTDLDAIEVMPSEASANFQPMQNIAMAIDPTYSPQRLNQKSTFQRSLPPEVLSPDIEEEESDDGNVYMPVQGQRRTASLEKKSKKNKNKEGCAQQ